MACRAAKYTMTKPIILFLASLCGGLICGTIIFHTMDARLADEAKATDYYFNKSNTCQIELAQKAI